MNIYHISFAPATRTACLHFWGCNFKCRACLCKKEIYDCHLDETKDSLYDPLKEAEPPTRFLSFEEVMGKLQAIEPAAVIFMGQEPTTDPELAPMAQTLHKRLNTHNILLTNGFRLSLEGIDEVVLSIKAHSDGIHHEYTGRSNKRVFDNFTALYHKGIRLQLESVLIPEYIDYPEIEGIAKAIATIDPALPYRIDAYLPVRGSPWRPPTDEEMDRAVAVARRWLHNVTCLKGKEGLLYEVIRII